LSDRRILLVGLDGSLADLLLRRYAPFAGVAQGEAEGMTIRFSREPRENFIEPPERAERNPVLFDGDGRRFRYLGYRVAGCFDLDAATGCILLAEDDYEPADRAIENFLLAVAAWVARHAGGGLVHAAGAAREGRGYIFYGASGAGKSTLAEATARRGIAVSDDLSLVMPGRDGALELVGNPFRRHLRIAPVADQGVPLAAGFRLIQGAPVRVERVPRVMAFAGLVANLPFVSDLLPRRPEFLAAIERDFAALPLAWLHFARDDSFWDAIAEAGL
jgi:hypothetical protein